MQNVTLNIADHAYSQVMALLDNFSQKEVQVVAKEVVDHDKKTPLDKLYGIFADYSTGQPITDEEIEQAVAQGAYERAMRSKTIHQSNLINEKPIADLTMAELGGILSPYVDERISDIEIDDAITQGIAKRAMLKDVMVEERCI